jgi:hypothetical protein
VSELHDKRDNARLAEVSDKLSRSLKACHNLVDDYRLKLAANSHEIAANDGDEYASGFSSCDEPSR